MHTERSLCRRARAAVALAAALAAPLAAHAGPYKLGVSQSVSQENNLLRVEDNQELPEGVSRRDTVYTTSVSGSLDQPLGRQRLSADGSLTHTQFQRNRQYDNNGYRLRLGLDWATVERLSGNVTASLRRSLAQFSNDEAGILPHANAERTRQLESNVRWGVSARLSAEAALDWRNVDFSAPEFASREFRQGRVYLGLRQQLAGDTWWAAGARSARGTYPNFNAVGDGSFEADRFRRQTIEWRGGLKPGGNNEIEARLGWGRTRYEKGTSRNVQGLFGGIDWRWRPTGHTRVFVQLARDPSQDSYFVTTLLGRGTLSYDRMATTVQLRGEWDLGAKTWAYLSGGYTDRALVRRIDVSLSQSDERIDDRVWQYGLGLRWTPSRTLLFGVELMAEERRHGTTLSRPYHSTSLFTFGQLTLD